MVRWPPMPLVKPFRALRFDARVAGPLGGLVAPPYDVIDPERLARLVASGPFNIVRLIRPHEPELAAARLAEWKEHGVLLREEHPAVWILEESYTGPDGVPRTRRGLAARVRLERGAAGRVLPHESTFDEPKEARLRLLRALRTKLSPIFVLHEGETPPASPDRLPDLDATLDGVRSRLWRLADSTEIEGAIACVRGLLIIADGHHRYEAALRFHEEEGTEETGYVLAVLVSTRDPGLHVFPTHRMSIGAAPALNGELVTTPIDGDAAAALGRLDDVPRDRSAFVLLTREGAVLAETPGGEGPLEALDTALVDRLDLAGVTFTPSAAEAEIAVASGAARAALLVRAPTIEQIAAFAVAGRKMPQKSTYFYPKLASGLLLSPFDE
jgi:uncharacterized protein (DUF1015 family)